MSHNDSYGTMNSQLSGSILGKGLGLGKYDSGTSRLISKPTSVSVKKDSESTACKLDLLVEDVIYLIFKFLGTDEKKDLFDKACISKDFKVLQLILTDTYINQTDFHYEYRWSGLIRACYNGHTASVAFLLSKKSAGVAIDVNQLSIYDFNSLLHATRNAKHDIVKLLIDAGINVNHINSNKYSALMYASEQAVVSMPKATEQQLEEDTEELDGDEKTKVKAKAKERLTSLDHLLRAGADTELVNRRGDTALIFATRSNRAANVRTLIDIGKCNVNHQNDNGWTALHYASKYNYQDTLICLLSAGADLSLLTTNEHFSALHLAVMSNHIEIAKLLLQAKADPRQKSKDQQTILMMSKSAEMDEVVLPFST